MQGGIYFGAIIGQSRGYLPVLIYSNVYSMRSNLYFRISNYYMAW